VAQAVQTAEATPELVEMGETAQLQEQVYRPPSQLMGAQAVFMALGQQQEGLLQTEM